jgi:hypothetical protein
MWAAIALLCALGGSFVVLLVVAVHAMRQQRSRTALMMLVSGDCQNCIRRGFCQYANNDPYDDSVVCPLARALALKERIDRLGA